MEIELIHFKIDLFWLKELQNFIHVCVVCKELPTIGDRWVVEVEHDSKKREGHIGCLTYQPVYKVQCPKCGNDLAACTCSQGRIMVRL